MILLLAICALIVVYFAIGIHVSAWVVRDPDKFKLNEPPNKYWRIVIAFCWLAMIFIVFVLFPLGSYVVSLMLKRIERLALEDEDGEDMDRL